MGNGGLSAGKEGRNTVFAGIKFLDCQNVGIM